MTLFVVVLYRSYISFKENIKAYNSVCDMICFLYKNINNDTHTQAFSQQQYNNLSGHDINSVW